MLTSDWLSSLTCEEAPVLSRWIIAAAAVPAVIVGLHFGSSSLLLSAPIATGREFAAHGSLRAVSPMLEPRSGHAAVLLANGEVLIVGGMRRNQDFYRSSELYDPATQRFSATGSMKIGRVGMAAVRLPSGKVLVTGGWTGHDTTDESEIYDPGTGNFADGGRMTTKRGQPEATLLRPAMCSLREARITTAQAGLRPPNSTILSPENLKRSHRCTQGAFRTRRRCCLTVEY